MRQRRHCRYVSDPCVILFGCKSKQSQMIDFIEFKSTYIDDNYITGLTVLVFSFRQNPRACLRAEKQKSREN